MTQEDRSRNARERWSLALVRTAASIPWATFSLFWLFVARAWLALDRLPRPHNPDPKDLDYPIHHVAIYLGLVSFPTLSPFLLVIGLFLGFRSSGSGNQARSSALKWALVALLGYAACLWTIYDDPRRLYDWFRD